MRLYPELAGPRTRQMTYDVLVLLLLLLFAFFAWAVREAVMTLTEISIGFSSIAEWVQDVWGSVADSLAGIPLVGGDIQEALVGISDATAGAAVETGQSITEAVTTAANVLSFVTFAAPTAIVLVLWLPRRMDRSRTWTAADRVLSASEFGYLLPRADGSARSVAPTDSAASPHRDAIVGPRGSAPAPTGSTRPDGSELVFPPAELLALRALCNLPLIDLVRYTPRPFEAFQSGDYAPLIRALYAYEGLRPPRSGRG